MTGHPVAFATAAPSAAPSKENIRYIAYLETPSRVVKWRSPLYLSSTPVVGDWIAVVDIVDINEVPSFNADFVGQLIKDTNTNWIYKAIDQTGSWILDISNNGFVYGNDLATAETLSLSYHGQYKKVTSTLTLTLPAGLTTNIEARLIVDAAATLTLQPDTGTTLNGDSITIDATNTTVTLHNNGNDWQVFS